MNIKEISRFHTRYGAWLFRLAIIAILLLPSMDVLAQTAPKISGNVFGGGRLANVNGNANITVNQTQSATTTDGVTTPAVGGVYGGNDIAGTVGGDDGSTIVVGTANNCTVSVGSVYGGGNGYYRYGNNTDAAPSDDTYQALTAGTVVYEWGNNVAHGAEVQTLPSANNIPSIKKSNITINGSATTIDSVFGGAKNAYVTLNTVGQNVATIDINNGTIYSVFGGNNYGGSIGGAISADATTVANIQITVDGTTQGADETNLGKDKGIRYLFGGGNKILAPKVDIDINEGQIDTLFAGGNSASVLATDVTVNITTPLYAAGCNTQTNPEKYDIRCLFGGNNAADMAILPSITLTQGGIHTLYGGGNSGDMQANHTDPVGGLAKGVEKSTFVNVASDQVVIDELYGGCQKASVDHCTYVNISNGYVGTVYGGCNISGNIGDSTYVLIKGGTICHDVFGGSNGNYACTDADGRYVGDPFAGMEDYTDKGIYIPSVSRTFVDMSAGTVNGNVYGGGNRAPVGLVSTQEGIASTHLHGGTIRGNAYGGGRSASVYGYTDMDIYGTITITDVYGGNDRYGNVSGRGRNMTALDGTTHLDQSNAASYVKVTETPHLGRVFGGGNGDYVYDNTSDPNYAGPDCGSTAPTQTSSWLDINMSCPSGDPGSELAYIGQTFGGGNAATVGNATSYIIGKGYIDQAFGGGNGADVLTQVKITIDPAHANSASGSCVRTNSGVDYAQYNVKTVFGGNNLATMNNAVPEINLVSGRFYSVYGGGNAGDMKGNGSSGSIGNLSTVVKINSANVEVAGYVYGGCNMADVYHGTYVLVQNGTINNVFGGNDISGEVGKELGVARIDLMGGTVNNLYGGSNGKYDYADGNVYPFNSIHTPGNMIAAGKERPVVDTAIVNATAGYLKGNLYGGGLAGTTGSTIVTVDGSKIDGNLFAGGCGATEFIGYCETELIDNCETKKPHVGNVTETANMTVHSLHAESSSPKWVYGGGHAGDVNNTNLVLDNCTYKFQTVYGGCFASNVTGTAHTTITKNDTNSVYIDTVYGGNNFAGYVYNTVLDIDGGKYLTIYGAGNGDYIYKTCLNPNIKALVDASVCCIDTVPYSQFITINLNPGAVVSNVYGGGNLGMVGKDLNTDGQVDRINTFTTLNGLPSTFTDNVSERTTLLPYGEYGSIVINVLGGYYNHHIFAGARGRSWANIYGRKHLVYGLKEVNMYGGYIKYSLYGGSESVDDGYPWECNRHLTTNDNKDRSTTQRPSTILNIMGGTIHKHCYGGGYQGDTYGSIFVNAGIYAVDSNRVWTNNYGNASYLTRTLTATSDAAELTGSWTDAQKWEKPVGEITACAWGNDNYGRYKPERIEAAPLYFDASIYNCSDWGAAGAVAEFNTRGVYGGETMIFLDGKGYHTSLASVGDLPALDIKYSLMGAGTSTEGGDVRKRIFVRHYGDYDCPSPSKEIFSIQRADKVVIDSSYFNLTGEQDAYLAYVTPNYSFSRIDTLILRGDNYVGVGAPARHIGTFRSEQRAERYTEAPNTICSIYKDTNDWAEKQSLFAATNRVPNDRNCEDYGSGPFCEKMGYTANPSNKIGISNGSYISIDEHNYATNSDSYGSIFGFTYFTSTDASKCYVYARAKQADTDTKNDGGFMSICPGYNTAGNNTGPEGTDELHYTTYSNNYRSWQIGNVEGGRNRHITIVANADPESPGCDDRWIYQDEHGHQDIETAGDKAGFAIAHARLEMPPAAEGHFFKINSVLVDQDNGGQVTLMNAAYNPYCATGGVLPTGSDCTPKGWQKISESSTYSDAVDQSVTNMKANPNYNFGLLFDLPSSGFNYNTATLGGNALSGTQVLAGGEAFTALNGFNSYPVASGGTNVITDLDFYLTYNTNFSTTIIRDVIFVMDECWIDSHGDLQKGAPIYVTVTISTVITKFSDIEVEMLAMYNEGISNEYVRKIVLPATFNFRNLRLTGVRWEYDNVVNNGKDGYAAYEGPEELGPTPSSDKCLWNVVDADAEKTVNNQFGFTLNLSENVTDNIANTLGWYDIQKRSIDLHQTISTANGGDWVAGSNYTGQKIENNTITLSDYNDADSNKNYVTDAGAIDIPLGSLDGRASAAIEGVLHFNGNLVYPDNAYVGRVVLTVTYKQKNPETGLDEDQSFHITMKVKTRKTGDTIYVASALHGKRESRSVAQDGSGEAPGKSYLSIERGGKTLHACLSTGVTDAGHSPDNFVISLSEAMSLYQEGDVICIIDTVDVTDDDNVTLRGFDYSMIQIIRYSGSHEDAPGAECAYLGPMIRLRGDSRFTVFNTWFNGSGITRTKNMHTPGDGVLDNDANGDKSRLRNIVYANAPMIVVTENASLTLGMNVRMSNNFNQAACTDATGNIQGFYGTDYPGGAIGIYQVSNNFSYPYVRYDKDNNLVSPAVDEQVKASRKGFPSVTIGDRVSIFDNMITQQNEGNNQGAAIYMNGGTLQLGNTTNGGEEIMIHHNYIVDKSITEDNNHAWFDGTAKSTRTTFTYNTSNCSTTPTTTEIEYYNLDTAGCTNPVDIFARRVNDQLGTLKVPVNHNDGTQPAALSNVYLTRKGSDDMTDTQTDYVSFKAELAPESLIGITKDFPGTTVRDTIQIAKVTNARPVTAENVWNNYNFFDDRTQAFTFYHSTVNNYTIYFQRCATFKEGIDALAANTYHPVSYHINDSSWCSAVRDSARFHLQGGFYPYKYVWKTSEYKQKQGGYYWISAYHSAPSAADDYKYDWDNAPVVRTRYTVGNNVQATTRDGGDFTAAAKAIQAAAKVDTCVLTGLSMPPSSGVFDYTYYIEGTDLTDNCLASQLIEIRVRRIAGDTCGASDQGTAPYLDYEWLGVGNEDSETPWTTGTVASATPNPGVDSSSFHTKPYDVARYLRIAKGVTVTPSVVPDGYNAWIVAHDYYKPQHTFLYQNKTTGTPAETNQFQDVKFCPGDMMNFSTYKDNDKRLKTLEVVADSYVGAEKLNGAASTQSFMMWDADPDAWDTSYIYVVPNYNSTIKAIYGPNDHWYEVVTSEPSDGTYFMDYYGNVTITGENGLAWLISIINGLNNQAVHQFHDKTITIMPKSDGEPYNMGAHLWTPLGHINSPFSGTFIDSSETAISNIIVNEPNLPYVGFFGNVEGATIRKVNLQSEFLKGADFVGGLVAMAHNDVNIINNTVNSLSSFCVSYCMGGLIGKADTNVIINGNTVDVDLLGNAIYAGGLAGIQGYNVTIGGADQNDDNAVKNNIAGVDATKLQSALYLGGLAGTATEAFGKQAKRSMWDRLLGRKPVVTEIADLRNNYVRMMSNNNAMFTGGLIGTATNVNLSNNYVYGTVTASNQAASLVAQVGANVTIDHCYYMDGTAPREFGLGSNTSGVAKTSSFSGQGNQVTTSEPIDGVDNLTRVLNRWVNTTNAKGGDRGYFTWTSDMLGVNSGYPIFGDPDMIPVRDSIVETACDEYNYNGTMIYSDTVIRMNFIDSVEMIDSTMTIVITIGRSENELFFDSVEAGNYYIGHGFALTADELEMLRGTTDEKGVRTVQVIDSLLTEHGCDSIRVLNLTIYTKGNNEVGIEDVETFDVSVYPNPTLNHVTVEATGIQSVEVFDALSRRIMNVEGKGDDTVGLDLDHCPTGTYYMRITTHNGVAIKKVIKK